MFGVCVLESALSFCAGFLYKSCMTYFFSRTVTMAQKSSGFVLKPLKPVPQSAISGKGIDLKRALTVRVRVAKLPKLFVEMLVREMEEAKEMEEWSTSSSNHS